MNTALLQRLSALRRWFAEEVRLLGLDSWADGAYAGPPDPEPCTSSDPRCQRTIERLAECRARMKRMKAGILDDAPYKRGADLATSFAAIKRENAPPVQLVKRAKK